MRPIKWTGSAKSIGEKYLLEYGSEAFKSASTALDAYGRAEMEQKLSACTTALDELKLIRFGAADGKKWHDGLEAEPSKADIISKFDESLKDINEGEFLEKKIAAVTKATIAKHLRNLVREPLKYRSILLIRHHRLHVCAAICCTDGQAFSRLSADLKQSCCLGSEALDLPPPLWQEHTYQHYVFMRISLSRATPYLHVH
jgi:hypothetical protein